MIAHVVMWVLTGMRKTLSPIEPSESMYTLEQGLVNAGFVFFSLAILATLIFGRFVCGWGCHVVALQDLCGWMMKKLGVRPRAFRSRLLVYAPLVLALYMFVWPTVKREVLKPLAGPYWIHIMPWVGDAPPPVFHSGGDPARFFRPEFFKADFWETFPAWYVAIPFLLICGFATVYFLGAKGFCTYGCPYGGFFAPADKLAIGRIRVTDACQHCGHCTSVCTSNVRVHEEVRDWGMVVDPGCMKCLDCVSVCPNEALYFGFGRPSALKKARTAQPAPPLVARAPDLTWPAEFALAGIFTLLVFGYRNWLGEVPLLMAMGIAGVGVFLVWKCWEMLREANVRLHTFQLRYRGRVRPAGVGLAALTAATLAGGAWGVIINASRFYAEVLDARIHVPYHVVFSAGYRPAEDDRELAERAMTHFRRVLAPREGGVGWGGGVEVYRRLAWLSAVSGQRDQAERYLLAAIEAGMTARYGPAGDLLHGLVAIQRLRGEDSARITAQIEAIAQRRPDAADALTLLGTLHLEAGNAQEAYRQAQALERLGHERHRAHPLTAAGRIFLLAARPEDARRALQAAIALDAHSAEAHHFLAIACATMGHMDDALAHLRTASDLEPHNLMHIRGQAEVLRLMGRHTEATELESRANLMQAPGKPPAPAAPPSR